MLEIALSVLAALGGGAVIIGGFAYWLGELWAKRLIQKEKLKLDIEIESHKIKLKKSELIFEKQFAAASELSALVRKLLPPLRHAEMDWSDACDEIAHNFEVIIDKLENYLCAHSAILNKEIKYLLSNSIGIASQSKFEITGPNVPASANKAANDLFTNLLKAEEILTSQVLGQATT